MLNADLLQKKIEPPFLSESKVFETPAEKPEILPLPFAFHYVLQLSALNVDPLTFRIFIFDDVLKRYAATHLNKNIF